MQGTLQISQQRRLNPLRLFFEILACLCVASLLTMLLVPRLAPQADPALVLPISVMLILLTGGPLVLWRCLAAGVKTSRERGHVPVRSLRSALVMTFTTLFVGLVGSALLPLALALDAAPAQMFGLFSAVLSCIVALVVWLLAFGRTRARALAREMTTDLQRLAKVVEHTSNAVIITDRQRRIVWVNQGFVRVTGYTPEQVLGQSPGALLQFDKTDRGEVERLRHALNAGQPFKGELLNRGRDGREYWLELEIQPLFEADRTLSGFMAIETDISQRKAMAAEVQRSQALLRGAIDAVGEGFVLFDPDDRLVLCNDKYRRLYQLSADLIVPGAGFEDIVRSGAQRGQYPEAAGRVEAWIAERLAAHRSGNASLLQKLDNGRTVRIVERRMPDGHTVGFRTDITDLVKATEAAQESLRAKGLFLANMSHEIRTPMNAVIGMTALALEGPLNTDQRELIGVVKDSANSLLLLINDILDFSKIEAGQLHLEHIDFDLRECLGAAVRTLAGKVREKGLTLNWVVAPDVPQRVLGDPHRLRQVLLNLLSNGTKFTAHGGLSVVISARSEGGASGDEPLIHVRVRDTGIGIAADKVDLIFTPFTQADGSTTREFGGTGLGLSICSSLVAQMGGTMWVESSLGEGSTFHFTVRLPAAGLAPVSAVQGQAETDTEVRDVLVLQPLDSHDRVLLDCLRQWRLHPVLFSDWAAASRALGVPANGGPVLSLLVKSSMLSRADTACIDGLLATPAQRARVILLADSDADVDPINSGRFQTAVPWPSVPSLLFDALTHIDGFAESAIAEYEVQEQVPWGEEFSGRRVLLAEDNPINQKLALRLLQQLGHEVEVVGNGALAVARSGSERFDLVFMDVQMPVMGGFEATTAIRVRDREAGSYTPIVAMTAHAMTGDRDRCLAVGMDGYVSKPISKAALDAAVREHALKRPRNRAVPLPAGAGTTPLVGGLFRLDMEPPLGEQPLQDRDLAVQRLGGDVGLYEELVTMFVHDLPELLARMRTIAHTTDLRRLQHEAHAVKGALAALAAEPLRQLAGELELACENADPAAALALLPRLEQGLGQLVVELSQAHG
jgi:PAS domain S-box-containing protein